MLGKASTANRQWFVKFETFTFHIFSLQIYCCLGALAIADSLHNVNADMLGWWLCERQLPSGGLNGQLERVSRIPACCIAHFWVSFFLCVKTRLCAKLITEIVFHQDINFHANFTYFRIKRFKSGLVLEQNQMGTQKWSLWMGFCDEQGTRLMQELSTFEGLRTVKVCPS